MHLLQTEFDSKIAPAFNHGHDDRNFELRPNGFFVTSIRDITEPGYKFDYRERGISYHKIPMCKELDKILKNCQHEISEQLYLAKEVLINQCLFDEMFEQADKFLGLLDCYISVALARENLQLNYPTSDLSQPQKYCQVRDLMVDYLPRH